MPDLWQGAVAPAFIEMYITTPAGGFDLTTVTAAVIQAFLPGGTEATFSATIVSATANVLRLRHIFASGVSEVPLAGMMTVYGRLTVPGGFLDSPRGQVPIRGKYEVS